MEDHVSQPVPDDGTKTDTLGEQMRELGATSYWQAVHLYAERGRMREQGLCRALLGFDLM